MCRAIERYTPACGSIDALAFARSNGGGECDAGLAAALYIVGQRFWHHVCAWFSEVGGWRGIRVDSIRTEGCFGVLSSGVDDGGAGAKGWRSVSRTERSGIGGGTRMYITSGVTGFENFCLKDSGRKSAFAKRRRCVVVTFGSRGNFESRSLVVSLCQWPFYDWEGEISSLDYFISRLDIYFRNVCLS